MGLFENDFERGKRHGSEVDPASIEGLMNQVAVAVPVGGSEDYQKGYEAGQEERRNDQ